MKILFVGSVIKTEDCNKYRGASIAGNKMQLGLVKALYHHIGESLSILSGYPIATYPSEKIKYCKGNSLELTNEIIAKKIPFINIFILKEMTKVINTFNLIIKWGKKNKKEKKIILCYNAFPYISLPVLLAAKVMGIKTICLVADVPIEGVVQNSGLRKIARKVETKATFKNLKKFDALAVLNENLIAEYSPDSRYIVIDGGFDLSEIPNSPCGGQWLNFPNNDKIRVVFSGTIIEYNGIVNLIKAAKLVKNPRFQLELYGLGPMVDFVINQSKIDSRIKYMGIVSNNEMMKIQQQAALLVSPLLPNHPVAKVAFPSKIVEYLVSGTPVVSSKVNGYTQEYLDNMYYFNDMSPKGMAKTIDDILKIRKEELIQKATNAREFIIRKKNWDIQCEKIINLAENL